MNNNTSIEAKIKKIMFAVDAYAEDDRYRHVLYCEIRMALTDTSRFADFGNTNPVSPEEKAMPLKDPKMLAYLEAKNETWIAAYVATLKFEIDKLSASVSQLKAQLATANNKPDVGKISQTLPVLFQMRHRVGGQWKNIHLEHENFKAFVEQTPDYEFRKLCVML